MRKRLVIDATVEQANALRRSLLSYVTFIAPNDVFVEVNTSSHTDEYVAQRIGLVPFTQVDELCTGLQNATVNVSGRSVYGCDVRGGTCAPTCDDTLIVTMLPKQEIRLSVSFSRGKASEHARFQRTVGVGMRSLSSTRQVIEYETLLDDDHEVCLREAIQALRERILHARRQLVGGFIKAPAAVC